LQASDAEDPAIPTRDPRASFRADLSGCAGGEKQYLKVDVPPQHKKPRALYLLNVFTRPMWPHRHAFSLI